jgi:hypothetical protein
MRAGVEVVVSGYVHTAEGFDRECPSKRHHSVHEAVPRFLDQGILSAVVVVEIATIVREFALSDPHEVGKRERVILWRIVKFVLREKVEHVHAVQPNSKSNKIGSALRGPRSSKPN